MKAQILAHRGVWTSVSEKNCLEAFERAFAAGFGVETDIRDLDNVLVVSHDPPRSDFALPVDQLFALYRRMNATGRLALNIKADGLALALNALLEDYAIETAFVFDMSVPDMRSYFNSRARVFCRLSDAETHPAFYDKCAGVWLDSFEIPHSPSEWGHKALADGKLIALVSPELHARPHLEAWNEWRAKLNPAHNDQVMVCTDFPVEALSFFQVDQ
ncbi:hypothetical protein EDE12_101240 [Methylosinus sp. sav-2]|jgi:glycerophosphoryl diester phosphodiesterase|uniref:hypothetical protein n=1 Tax=Methylosinus sp. sav-2 TaxID=2485168 RepID=UPI00056A5479|nr:hypothetical protein [Methylosinus sp. sav-2]TDX66706.1 hypothetical protein EDE12_101240 [Methylosinus sp. sav-2]